MLARTALGFFLAAVVPLLSAAEPRAFSGRVSDGSATVAGAIVTVSSPGFVKSATTDGEGRFVLDAIPPGRYEFRTTAHGYAVFECPVMIHSGGAHRNSIEVKRLIPTDRQSVSVLELAGRKQARIRSHRNTVNRTRA